MPIDSDFHGVGHTYFEGAPSLNIVLFLHGIKMVHKTLSPSSGKG